MSNMSKLLKLICMVSILMMLTGCSGDDPEPEPQPIQETWQMTYDDYRVLIDSHNPEFKNIIRDVTVLKDGDDISIKGLFAEYPDAYVKGTIKGDNVLIDNTQAIATDNDETVYFHWGYADISWDYDYSEHEWSSEVRSELGHQPAFIISDDGNTMTISKTRFHYGVIWYDSKGKSGGFRYNEWYDNGKQQGSGYPDVDIKLNVVLRKVAGNHSVN